MDSHAYDLSVPASMNTRIALLLFVLLATPLAAQRSIDWEEAPQYEITVGGKVDYTIRAYQPTSATPHLILIGKTFNPGVLVDLSAKKVLSLTAKDYRTGAEYMLVTAGIPKGGVLAGYTVKNGVTSFAIPAGQVAIRVKESLVGEVSESIILAHSPVYRIQRDAYRPKAGPVAALKKFSKKTQFVVMFATWCPTCKAVIPAFMRLMQAAANPNFSVKYIGIAMGGAEPRRELERYGSEYPDVIVFRDGRELGRVTGKPSKTLEESLLALVQKP
jgi:thiol-disulfide isomerase/thioredoxin